MIRRLAVLAVGLAACGGGSGPPATPTPVTAARETAAPATVDSLWAEARGYSLAGRWDKAATAIERVLLEFSPGDRRIPEARFRLGEAQLGLGNHLQAAREFRRVSDETPSIELAPEALLRAGDAYAELWRRPELDPSYGQTALATYQELLNRYPDTPAASRAQAAIGELQEKFATKGYKAGLFYLRLKAYDSAILYLRDVVATYPRTSIAPAALVKLVEAYRSLGYREDVQETCGYLRRFHPDASRANEVCPPDTTSAS